MARIQSLRGRLMLWLALTLTVVWILASLLAYEATKEAVNTLFDSQQGLLARQLLGAQEQGIQALLQAHPDVLPSAKNLLDKDERGNIDSDALAFAVFDREGRRRWSDGADGRRLVFVPGVRGFVNQGRPHSRHHSRHAWRVLFMASQDGASIIAVGQEVGHRRKAVRVIVATQLWPWLAALAAALALIWWVIGAQTKPLRGVARELMQRAPDDDTPIAPERVTLEVRPVIEALNALRARARALIAHTRRFTADAAHELRSPLAALRVQAEVAQLAAQDPVARRRALAQLTGGIDRAARLVEQLLALSRLDPMGALPDSEPLDWPRLLQDALHDAQAPAQARGITLTLCADASASVALPARGNATLLTLLLRNLLDNAVRYTPTDGHVTLRCGAHGLAVEDDGPGVAAQYLDRIHERFFRPPGQSQPGSGLGLSIALRVAELHGLRLTLENRAEGGFRAAMRMDAAGAEPLRSTRGA
ncbi:MAG: sensor histidine kinase N-terminal domain-containing protein [Burkholderiaceae bacterium]|jgi:two-component system sensor histidine kinase QseC|nr:sensor histidine kinase N-terminal domain-containing protein [Burkholderiaceae bacterium]